MWRLAEQSDIPSIERFLRDHIQSSMFPLGNLRDHGLDGPHPRSMTFWLLGDRPRAALGITKEGMILPQCPGMSHAELSAAAELIRDVKPLGVIGDAVQVRQVINAAGWQGRATSLGDDEPAFALSLDDLVIPELTDVDLVPLVEMGREQAKAWRKGYLLETPGLIQKDLDLQAMEDVDRYLERDSHRVLLQAGKPVAMTGFNVMLPDVVQIGGVFTPCELRGRGYARTAVALHLAEARAAGARKAVLFAASNAAARAYVAIGFAPAGTFSLVLFRHQMEVAS